jgi:hypothetical protein
MPTKKVVGKEIKKEETKPVAKKVVKKEVKEKVDLYKAAHELFTQFDLSQAPETYWKEAELKTYILAAAKEIIPEDVITDSIKEALKEVKFDLEKHLSGKREDRSKTEGSDKKDKKAPRERKEKTAREQDEFGYTVGTKMSLFAQAIAKKPMTMDEVKELPWNTNKAPYPGTWKDLVERGFGVKTSDGKLSIVKKAKK